MAEFKAVLGPWGETVKDWAIIWDFGCIWTDGQLRGYTLRFSFNTRKFSVKPYGTHRQAALDRKYAQKDLFLLPEFQRNIARSGFVSGRVTDILKARLTEEQLARATALAIRHKRN